MPALTQQNSGTRIHSQRSRLLLIEDNPNHWVMIQAAMQRCLPEVQLTRVSSEKEALAYLDECQLEEWKLPRLILLDLYLPDREMGWRLLERIKSMPGGLGKIPVILLSASSNPADIAEAYRRGCSSYLLKPAAFEQWLESFQMLRTYWWETVTLPRPEVSLF